MPEGPMNVDPMPVSEEVEAAVQNTVEAAAEAGQVDVGSQPVQFPTHQPRLSAGGQKTLKALQGH